MPSPLYYLRYQWSPYKKDKIGCRKMTAYSDLICVGNLNHYTPFDLLDGAFCRIGRHVPDLIKLQIGFIYMFL